MNDSLRVESLSKRVGDAFRLEASFEIASKERAALVGKSGIGKTTLLRMIAGLESTDGGRVWLGDREITGVPPQKREIGFVFQEQALFSGRSVFENVAFGLRMRGVNAGERESRVLEWLGKLGLSERGRESVDHLSGGERQRVALARALVLRPQLIIMDEPFTGLDSSLRDSLRDEVLRLHSESLVPLLFVAHGEGDISRLATKTICFEESFDEIGKGSGPLRRARDAD